MKINRHKIVRTALRITPQEGLQPAAGGPRIGDLAEEGIVPVGRVEQEGVAPGEGRLLEQAQQADIPGPQTALIR